MKIKWNKVTWYSWLLAGVIFLIVIPLLVWYFLGQYNNIEAINFANKNLQSAPTVLGTPKLLSYHYKIEDSQVLYNNGGNYEGKGWSVISGADPKTFQIISDEERSYFSFAKDVSHVFLRNNIIKDADPKTFKVGLETYPSTLGSSEGILYSTTKESFSRDKAHVFACMGKIMIDSGKFKFIGDSFVTDGSVVYDLDTVCGVLKDVDPNSLKQLTVGSDSLFKDKNAVYAHFQAVEIDEIDRLSVDANSFEHFRFSFSKDNQHVYTIDLPPDANIIEGVSSDGFKYIGSFYFKNNQKVYRVIYDSCVKDNCSSFELKEVVGADPLSFQLVGADKDKTNGEIYFNFIGDMNIGTSTEVDAKDKNHSYSNGVAL